MLNRVLRRERLAEGKNRIGSNSTNDISTCLCSRRGSSFPRATGMGSSLNIPVATDLQLGRLFQLILAVKYRIVKIL
jgi:hypothetical protein